MNAGGFNLQGMMKKMGDMQKKLEEQIKKNNSEKEIKEYCATSGDDGLEVSIVMDGNFCIKSLAIGEELKKLIICDSQVYFNILIDLIIAAYNKAKSQIEEDSADIAGLGDFDDLIPGDMKNLLGNLGNFLK
jgi:DNA-binding protein YbaB